jgi:hypothetical protein
VNLHNSTNFEFQSVKGMVYPRGKLSMGFPDRNTVVLATYPEHCYFFYSSRLVPRDSGSTLKPWSLNDVFGFGVFTAVA